MSAPCMPPQERTGRLAAPHHAVTICTTLYPWGVSIDYAGEPSALIAAGCAPADAFALVNGRHRLPQLVGPGRPSIQRKPTRTQPERRLVSWGLHVDPAGVWKGELARLFDG